MTGNSAQQAGPDSADRTLMTWMHDSQQISAHMLWGRVEVSINNPPGESAKWLMNMELMARIRGLQDSVSLWHLAVREPMVENGQDRWRIALDV